MPQTQSDSNPPTVVVANQSVAPSEISVNTAAQSQAQRFLAQANQHPRTIIFDGKTYTASVARVTYRLNQNKVTNIHRGSLIDRGANGGLSGDDVRVISKSTTQFADVHGIANSEVQNAPLSTVAGVIESTTGPIIGIFHQYAHYGKGHTIHSPLQMEAFGIEISDSNIVSRPGKQHGKTPEGYVIPFEVHQGLVYMPMRPPTDEEMDKLPQVFMTSDSNWDPSDYDTNKEEITTEIQQTDAESSGGEDDMEELDHSEQIQNSLIACEGEVVIYRPKSILPHKPDYQKLRPLFGWSSPSKIRDTIRSTTQWYKADQRLPMQRHWKSCFPGANVPRRNETVATDTIFSDTPAWDDGIGGHG